MSANDVGGDLLDLHLDDVALRRFPFLDLGVRAVDAVRLDDGASFADRELTGRYVEGHAAL